MTDIQKQVLTDLRKNFPNIEWTAKHVVGTHKFYDEDEDFRQEMEIYIVHYGGPIVQYTDEYDGSQYSSPLVGIEGNYYLGGYVYTGIKDNLVILVLSFFPQTRKEVRIKIIERIQTNGKTEFALEELLHSQEFSWADDSITVSDIVKQMLSRIKHLTNILNRIFINS